MDLTEKIIPAPESIFRMVGEEAVILHLGNGIYFGLDSVGARIWELMETNLSLSQICDELSKEYDVPRDRLEHDLIALTQNLLEHNLVKRVNG